MPVNPRFCKASELVAVSFERARGFIAWVNSDEGKKWLEDSKIKEYQYKRIAHEGMRCAL